jgi:hypothetical protein
MRISNCLIGFFLIVTSLSAAATEVYLDAQQLAQAGAVQLALSQLPASGVSDDGLRLQWQLLAQINSAADILKAADSLPPNTPADVLQTRNLLAAKAALKLANPSLARQYLAALLWGSNLDASTYQIARALVVRSYLIAPISDDVTSMMLRYQQEFGKDTPLLQDYAWAMLQAGRQAEMAWVRAQLPNTDAVAILLDVRAGLFSDTQSKQYLQTAISTSTDASKLTVLRTLVSEYNAPELLLQIDERLLNLPKSTASADNIWAGYRSMTQTLGNVRLLLFGSDTGWAELARASMPAEPMMSRAVWAYLAREAKEAALRQTAQQALLTQLRAAKLDGAALRLFEAAWPNLPAAVFNTETRYQLGVLAIQAGKFDETANLWRDASELPTSVTQADWSVQRARLFAQQGWWPLAITAVITWLPDAANATVNTRWKMLNIVLAAPSDHTDLLKKMLVSLNAAQQRIAMQRLGALETDDKKAAMWLLAVAANANDSMAEQARLAAAVRLKKAGLDMDAKRLYEIVQSNSADPAQQAWARDALDGL